VNRAPIRARRSGGEQPVRRAGEQGASTPEYVGVLILVAALIAALWAVPLAPLVGDWARYAACSLFGGECERPLTTADGAIPGPTPVSMVCLEGSERERLGGDVTLFSAKVSGDLACQVDRTSDGHHDVTLELSGGLAAELVTGGKISADGLGAKQGRQGALELGANASVAPVFRFSSQAAAVAFTEQARELVTGPVDDLVDWRTLIPVYGPGRIPVNQYRRVRDFQAPPPARLRVEGSVEVIGSGDIYGGSAGASGVLSAGQTLGADIDLETGAHTYYVALDSALAVELGLGARMVPAHGGVGVSGEVGTEVTVAYTVDGDGTPTTLAFGVAADVHGGIEAGLDGLMFDGSPFGTVQPDLKQAVAALSIDAREEFSGSVSATATIDLTDPAAQELGRDLVLALGSRDRDGLTEVGGDLLRYLGEDARLEAQFHHGSRSQFDIEAKGGQGLAFGFGLGHEASAMQLGGAWVRPPGGGFQRGYCS
jgi:hypothetical protein